MTEFYHPYKLDKMSDLGESLDSDTDSIEDSPIFPHPNIVIELTTDEIYSLKHFPYFPLSYPSFPFPRPNIRGRNMNYFLPAEPSMDGSDLIVTIVDEELPVDLRHHIRIRRSLRDYAPQEHPFQD